MIDSQWIEQRRSGSEESTISIGTWEKSDRTYRSRVLIVEDSGGFVAFASRLPGVVSQGDTEQEALENLADAYRLSVQEYLESGQQIPWEDVDVGEEFVERWIMVDV